MWIEINGLKKKDVIFFIWFLVGNLGMCTNSSIVHFSKGKLTNNGKFQIQQRQMVAKPTVSIPDYQIHCVEYFSEESVVVQVILQKIF